MKFYLYKASGERSEVFIEPGKQALKTLQELVGGNIEVVTTRDGLTLIIDEEGRCKGKQFNSAASIIFSHPRDYIAGDALIVDTDEFIMWDDNCV